MSTTLKSTDSGLPKKNSKQQFVGRLQPVSSRVAAVPMVNYAKGGCDFRTPQHTSSLGRQILSLAHMNSAGSTAFGEQPRFLSSETIGVGPGALAPQSSLQKQLISKRRSAESTSFGTSTRDGALKLYATYTAKK